MGNEYSAAPNALQIREQIEARRKLVEVPRCEIENSAKRPGSKDSGECQTPPTMLNDEWGDPLPLKGRPAQADYPVDSLPPLIRDAVIEVQAATQAPTPMVANGALAALATAAQGLINIRRNSHLVGPASLFFLTLGDSGERKSTVDDMFAQPLRGYHKEQMVAGVEKLSLYRSQFQAWQAKCDGITTAIRSSQKTKNSGNIPNTCELEKRLADLQKNEPRRPLIPKILVLDITTEKLFQQLAKEWPSCLLNSAEGGLVFGGRSFNKENQVATLAAFNALWSDEPLRISRKTSESFEVSGSRLSISLLVQPGVFGSFLESSEVSRSIGFLARCLFSFPDSTQGTRLYREAPNESTCLDKFNSHITKLLEIDPILNGRLIPRLIDIKTDGKKVWTEFHDEIESQLGKGGEMESLRDFGSKAAEQAARLAGVFQISRELNTALIDKECMAGACEVIRWHLSEVKRYFGTHSPQDDTKIKNAAKLEEYLIKSIREKSDRIAPISLTLQRGPGKLRKKEKLLPVLKFLEERGRVRLMDGHKFVEVNPALWKANDD